VVCGARVRRSIPPSRRASSRSRRPQASQDQAAAARPGRPGLVSHQARWGVVTTSSGYGDNQRCPTLTLPPPDAYHRKTRPQNCSMTEGLPATSRWPPPQGLHPGAERRPRQLTAPAGDRVWCWSRLRTTRIDLVRMRTLRAAERQQDLRQQGQAPTWWSRLNRRSTRWADVVTGGIDSDKAEVPAQATLRAR
jgi:hypothetical protein